jgi:NCAIR mutase (PurE)-related protein
VPGSLCQQDGVDGFAVKRDQIRELLTQIADGRLSIEAAVEDLSRLPFVDTVDARIDTHRALRHGIPEVVFGSHKSVDQIVDVVSALREAQQEVLVTRVVPEVAERVLARVGERFGESPEGSSGRGEYDPVARLLFYGEPVPSDSGKGTIGVISAGTADQPVAAEAAAVATRFGNHVEVLQDVGVAGLHRLLASQDTLRRARVLIVVAGMEGALPSVVGGLVDKPVIAVPTSVGYGASFGGLTALLGMLTSCASNVTVVNIDNGFGAAYAATLINRL